MDEGLELSLAAHSTRSVTLCLTAFARLAFVEGDPQRAALLAGAVDGLRRRVGLRPWPLLRRDEAELVAQVREALGPDRFDAAVRRRLPAQPAGGGGRRPRPTRRARALIRRRCAPAGWDTGPASVRSGAGR